MCKQKLHFTIIAILILCVGTKNSFLFGENEQSQNGSSEEMGLKGDISLVRYSKPLHILFVTTVFPKLSETFVLDQITGFIDRGHDVHIFSFSKGDLGKVHKKVTQYNLIERTFYKSLPAKRPDYDIIFCAFGIEANQFLSLKKRYGLKGRYVTCFRGYDLSLYIKNKPKIYENLLREGDLFLPVCDYFKNRLFSLGCRPEKITVHYDTIDLERFRFKTRSLEPGEKIRIAMVGRLTEKKGHEYGIKAFAQILSKYPSIELYIVGDGNCKKNLENLIEELGLDTKVKMVGMLRQDELIEFLDSMHILVQPSITAENGNQETMPQILKEAMAMGLPVISTYHSGIPELITEGVTGFLVPEKDVDRLAARIEYLIENPQIWPSVTQAARKVIEEKFDLRKANECLEAIFEELARS